MCVTNLAFFPMSELLQVCAGDIINVPCHIRKTFVCAGDISRQYLCIIPDAGVYSIYSERHDSSNNEFSRVTFKTLSLHLYFTVTLSCEVVSSDIISHMFQKVSVLVIVSKTSRGSLAQIHESCCKCK